jgi:hypothetical protein
MFRRWQEQAAHDGKSILCMIVLGLTNDIKFCLEKTSVGQSANYPRDVGYLVDQLEMVLGGWSRCLNTPVIYAGAAASYHKDPRRITSEVCLDNLNTSSRPRVQPAKALARLHNRLESLSTTLLENRNVHFFLVKNGPCEVFTRTSP